MLTVDVKQQHNNKSTNEGLDIGILPYFLGYELIPYPAYLSDLAPSDFFLFPNLKKDIRGRHFQSDEEVVAAVE